MRLRRSDPKPAPPPTWVKPQLAKLVEKAPDGPDWLHELKLDGYRMHARLDDGRVQILTRRGNDWTEKYPAIAKSIAALPAGNAYLDGELCGVLPNGRTAFNLIQNATDTGQGSLVFFLFDGTSPIGVLGSRSSVSTGKNSSLSGGVIPRAADIGSGRCSWVTTPVKASSFTRAESGLACLRPNWNACGSVSSPW
jgi:ATP dependent DNA ligase domain